MMMDLQQKGILIAFAIFAIIKMCDPDFHFWS